MVVLSKKKINIITMCIFLALFTFSFQIANEEKKEMEQAQQTNIDNKTTEATAIPSSGKVIIIDAGHGSPDERSRKFSRNNRGTNQFTNSKKSSKLTRANWK